MSALRSALAALLLTAMIVVGGFSLMANWAQRHLLDDDRWTSAVAPLIERSDVQSAVTTALVDSYVAHGLPSSLASTARGLTARAVATPAFAAAWRTAVRASHQEVVAAIRGQDRGLTLQDRVLAIDLGALFDSVTPQLTRWGIPLVSALPRPSGEVVLDSSPEAVRALKAARFADRWAQPSLIATVLLAIAGLVCARRRGRALILTGLSVGVLALLGWVGWLAARSIATQGANAIGAAALRNLTSDVSTWLLLTALGGAAAVVVGLGLSVGARSLRPR